MYGGIMFTPNPAPVASNTAGQSTANEARTEVRMLRADVEKLLMITEALWEIVKREHGYTDEDLIQLVERIDLKDGRLDGKVSAGGPKECPNCHRPVSPRHAMCLYCATDLAQASPFTR